MTPVQKARELCYAAERRLSQAMELAYPPGRETYYKIGRNWAWCIVVKTHGDRVKVRGIGGTEFWVNGHRMRGAAFNGV